VTKIEQEIEFLKNFRQRFNDNKTYRSAIEDMWREGLITPKAYKEIISEEAIQKTTSKFVSATKVAKVAKKTINSLEEGVTLTAKKAKVVDPCSHGGGYRSSC